jgi:putative ABC transport system permease protein
MFLQLVLIGYVLTFIFASKNIYLIFLILSVMMFAASYISLRPLQKKSKNIYLYSLVSISISATFILLYSLCFVLDLDSLNHPRYIIPLAGMLFSNSMNAISIAAERFENEICHSGIKEAKSKAYKASLIPIINSFFAVGVVAIPGMMTGQILSGVSPMIAVKYQIMIMFMILSSSGIASALFLELDSRDKIKKS